MAESDFDANADLYEYDAPSQVVDLKELQNAESDDKWFGKFSPPSVHCAIAGHCFNNACGCSCWCRMTHVICVGPLFKVCLMKLRSNLSNSAFVSLVQFEIESKCRIGGY